MSVKGFTMAILGLKNTNIWINLIFRCIFKNRASRYRRVASKDLSQPKRWFCFTNKMSRTSNRIFWTRWNPTCQKSTRGPSKRLRLWKSIENWVLAHIESRTKSSFFADIRISTRSRVLKINLKVWKRRILSVAICNKRPNLKSLTSRKNQKKYV